MSGWDSISDSATVFTDGVKEITELNVRDGVANIGLGYTRLVLTAVVGSAVIGALYMVPFAGNPVRQLVGAADGILTKIANVVRG